MGVTGAGKSTFVNTLKPGSVHVEHGLASSTAPLQAVQMYLDAGQTYSVTVVDTPGFDDSSRSDAEVFAEITEYLAAQYMLNIPLKGIIYLHQIHETKMRGSSTRYLEMFQEICGDEALKNVVLVTTRWDAIPPDQLRDALGREQELINKWWAPMLKRGSHIKQFRGAPAAAKAMVLGLVRDCEDVVLDVQRELVDYRKPIGETKAGASFGKQLENDINTYKRRHALIEAQLADIYLRKNKQSANLKPLKRQKQMVEKALRRLEASQSRMQARVGDTMLQKIEGQRLAMQQNKAEDGEQPRRSFIATGIAIFVAVCHLAFTVIDFAGLV